MSGNSEFNRMKTHRGNGQGKSVVRKGVTEFLRKQSADGVGGAIEEAGAQLLECRVTPIIGATLQIVNRLSLYKRSIYLFIFAITKVDGILEKSHNIMSYSFVILELVVRTIYVWINFVFLFGNDSSLCLQCTAKSRALFKNLQS